MHQPAPWAPVVIAVYKECVEAIESIPGASVDHNKFVSVHYRNCEAKGTGRGSRRSWTGRGEGFGAPAPRRTEGV